MSAAVTRTKLIVPRRRPDLLSRPRLLGLLDDLLDYPFTLISAPAGYGKTSLMIDLASQVDFPVCWYSIDSLDADLTRFLSHLIAAIQLQFSEFGNSTLNLLADLPDPGQDLEGLINTLVNELYDSVDEHFLICLDDYQEVGDQPEINQFISRFGQLMDDNAHLLLASRSRFEIPDLPLLISRRMVKGIGFDDLAFQVDEIKTYFAGRSGTQLPDQEAQRLAEESEGWITGLLLTASAAKQPERTSQVRDFSGTDLFAYLAEQVLEKQPPDLQEFMLQTAVLPEFTQATCGQLLRDFPQEKIQDLIQALVRDNLFVLQVDADGTWIRYHALFREFLLARLQSNKPDQEQRLLKRLLGICLENRDWENAFETARRLQDSQAMAEVIEKASSTLFHQGRLKLLASWLEQIRSVDIHGNSKLLIIQSLINLTEGNLSAGLLQINLALSQKSEFPDHSVFVRALLCRVAIYRLSGKYEEALIEVRSIKEIANKQETDPKLLAENYRESGLNLFNLGRFHEAKDELEKSLAIYQNLNDMQNIASVHHDIGLLLLTHGYYDEAFPYLLKSRSICRDAKNTQLLPSILNNLGILSILTGDFDSAEDYLFESISVADLLLDKRIKSYATASLGDLYSARGNYEKSLGLYQSANRLAELTQEVFLLSYISICQASQMRFLGRINHARDQLEIARTYATQSTSRMDLGAWLLEKGYVELETGCLEEAEQALEKARAIFIKANKPLEAAKTSLGLALSAQAGQDPTRAARWLKSCLQELDRIGTSAPLLPELAHHQKKLKELQRALPEAEKLAAELEAYVCKISGAPDREKPETLPATPASPALEIRVLGRTEVLREGRPLEAPEWIHQKTVRELFFYLLTLPRGASKEEIGLIFWPDSSPQQLTCQFKNAVYRLRRAVGREVILYDRLTRNYRVNPEADLVYDAAEFESACQLADDAQEREDKIRQLHLAIKIYKHPYGPRIDGIWAEPIRHRFYLLYESISLLLAEIMLAKDDPNECLKLCNDIINIEPSQEIAYQLSMQAHAMKTDIKNVVYTFNLCNQNLIENLGVNPSSKTVDLYKRLRDTI